MATFLESLKEVFFPSVVKTGDKEQDRQNATSAFLESLGKMIGGVQVQNAGFEDDRGKIKEVSRDAYWKNPWNKVAAIAFLKERGIDATWDNVRNEYVNYLWREREYGDGSKAKLKKEMTTSTTPVNDSYVDASGQRRGVFNGFPELPEIKESITLQQAPRRKM